MACRGVFFALTSEQAESLLAARGDEEVLVAVEAIEEAWDEDNLAECDKSWDALHRLFTNGALECGNGSYPWSHVVLGPKQLHEADDYFVSFVSAEQVRDVVAALQPITREWFAERYRTVVPSDYAPVLLRAPRGLSELRSFVSAWLTPPQALSLSPQCLAQP